LGRLNAELTSWIKPNVSKAEDSKRNFFITYNFLKHISHPLKIACIRIPGKYVGSRMEVDMYKICSTDVIFTLCRTLGCTRCFGVVRGRNEGALLEEQLMWKSFQLHWSQVEPPIGAWKEDIKCPHCLLSRTN